MDRYSIALGKKPKKLWQVEYSGHFVEAPESLAKHWPVIDRKLSEEMNRPIIVRPQSHWRSPDPIIVRLQTTKNRG